MAITVAITRAIITVVAVVAVALAVSAISTALMAVASAGSRAAPAGGAGVAITTTACHLLLVFAAGVSHRTVVTFLVANTTTIRFPFARAIRIVALNTGVALAPATPLAIVAADFVVTIAITRITAATVIGFNIAVGAKMAVAKTTGAICVATVAVSIIIA